MHGKQTTHNTVFSLNVLKKLKFFFIGKEPEIATTTRECIRQPVFEQSPHFDRSLCPPSQSCLEAPALRTRVHSSVDRAAEISDQSTIPRDKRYHTKVLIDVSATRVTVLYSGQARRKGERCYRRNTKPYNRLASA